MTPRLLQTMAQTTGSLRAHAVLQDPDVRLPGDPGEPPTVTIEEGGVVLAIEFPDIDCVRRFQVRVAQLVLPDDETITHTPRKP